MGVFLVQRRRPDLTVTLIALLSLPLFFYGLGATYLWQDEAQTALLGRSVLANGVPMVGHGAESVSAVQGKDEGIGGIYFQISWLQAYLAAASFKVFGESSWSARLPFALAGWSCVPLVAWGMRNAGASVLSGRVAAFLTALSVPLIICSRQARYYALTAAFTLLAMGTYAALCMSVKEGDRRTTLASISFGTAACLLVLSFDVAAIGVLSALAVHWVLTAEEGARWERAFWIPWAVSGLLLGAWIGLSFTAPSRQENAGLGSLLKRVRQGAFYYLGQINAHIVPLPVLLTLASLWRRMTETPSLVDVNGNRRMYRPPRRRRSRGNWRSHPPAGSLFPIRGSGAAHSDRSRRDRAGLCVVSRPMGQSSCGRYDRRIHHLQRTSRMVARGTLGAREIERSYNRARPESGAPCASCHARSRTSRSAAWADCRDGGYLRRHAGEGDVLVATYGDLPLKFHTRLTIYGGETAQLPPENVKADWIWSRNMTVYENVRPVAEWVERELSRDVYRPVQLPAVDRRYENREDPEQHIFSNPGPDGPPVTIYRLSKAAE